MRLVLKSAIWASGLSQLEVGLRARIGESRLSSIVRGRVQPTEDEGDRLAQVLGMSASALFGPPTAAALAQAARLEWVEKTA
jgi:transcriptional regulator with XRE-family HTH domain